MAGSRACHTVISLRDAIAEDAGWLEDGLALLTSRVGYPENLNQLLRDRKRAGSRRARIIVRDGASVGLVLYRMHTPRRGSACFELVAVTDEHARRGAGMTAASLAEEEMRAAGIRRVFAPAAAKHGISMYFWIRLGYAPILRGEWPCARDDIAWLRRDVVAP